MPTDAAGGASVSEDPIFQQKQSQPRPQKSTVLVWQFFLVPLLIVVAALAVFLLFGAFAGSQKSPQELLQTVATGSSNEREQAVHQLSLAINDARDEARLGDSDEPPFYADPSFQRGIVSALEASIEDQDEPMIIWLALSSGRIQAAGALPLLEELVFPDGRTAYPSAVRQAAAQALTFYDSRVAEPLLVRAAGTSNDDQIRATGLSGLARLGITKPAGDESPAVLVALREGVKSAHAGSRINAAVGLAVRGIDEDPVIAILRDSLSRDGLSQMGVPVELQSQALRNACRAAGILGSTELRAPIERLTDPKVEGDDAVREYARRAVALIDEKEDENA